MHKFKLDPLEGTTNGHVRIVARAADSKRGQARFFVECVCGAQMIRMRSRLTGPRAMRSCGCNGQGRTANRWTEADIEFLRREYPVHGYTIAAQMNRTEHAVRYKANKLGIVHKYERHYIGEWSKEEDAIIHRHYPTNTLKCLELLPTRSKSQIRHRAHKLGVHCKRGRRANQWSRAELKVLKEHYAEGGWEAVQTLLPHRSRDAIFARARAKKLAVAPKWTPDEEKEIIRLYTLGGTKACLEHFPDRSVASIRGKARKLGALMQASWTEEEIEIVRQHFPAGGAKKCMELMPTKTRAMVASVCKKYGIRSHSWWSEEEEAILLEHYGRCGARALKDRLPHHTEAAIRHKAKKLGLHSDRRWSEEEIDVVRRLYAEQGSKGCAVHLPGYTLEAIRNKAQQIGKIYCGKGAKPANLKRAA